MDSILYFMDSLLIDRVQLHGDFANAFFSMEKKLSFPLTRAVDTREPFLFVPFVSSVTNTFHRRKFLYRNDVRCYACKTELATRISSFY